MCASLAGKRTHSSQSAGYAHSAGHSLTSLRGSDGSPPHIRESRRSDAYAALRCCAYISDHRSRRRSEVSVGYASATTHPCLTRRTSRTSKHQHEHRKNSFTDHKIYIMHRSLKERGAGFSQEGETPKKRASRTTTRPLLFFPALRPRHETPTDAF